MKKGRHRRYEEARALKQNQDLDLDSIFDSLDVGDQNDNQSGNAEDEDSPAFNAWADDYEDGAAEDVLEETAETS